jgi:hypothetical protein
MVSRAPPAGELYICGALIEAAAAAQRGSGRDSARLQVERF